MLIAISELELPYNECGKSVSFFFGRSGKSVSLPGGVIDKLNMMRLPSETEHVGGYILILPGYLMVLASEGWRLSKENQYDPGSSMAKHYCFLLMLK